MIKERCLMPRSFPRVGITNRWSAGDAAARAFRTARKARLSHFALRCAQELETSVSRLCYVDSRGMASHGRSGVHEQAGGNPQSGIVLPGARGARLRAPDFL